MRVESEGPIENASWPNRPDRRIKSWHEKSFITCAVTGSIHTPSMSPYLPITPDEIAHEDDRCRRGRRRLLHLHARNPIDGRPAFDPAIYRQFLPQIHAATDAVINITTGGSYATTLDDGLRGRSMFPRKWPRATWGR
ncbi:hypothetical protein BZM27_53385 [Paraburkholderia steynii]|uniref:3-keto-5-aminohexanoate cleavage protein n=1 Tax=Paraburkholderia steynii TaxID=1245441 RepID=A0A4V2NFX7_9BURK|nr:hypothetical protein BZM27_53385 [Paraburkholderia steynii]